MKRVAVIGVEHTVYGLEPERSLKSLFSEAARAAFADVSKGMDPREVEEAFIGSLSTGGSQH